MRLHRFIVPIDLHESLVSISDKEVINQIIKVFRLKIGDSVILCDGKNHEAEATLEAIHKDLIQCRITKTRDVTTEARRKVVLYCAVLKNEHFELVVQKATEVGVSRIVPIVTKRTIKTNIRHDRLNKIAREAAEQSGRGRVPEIAVIMNLENALEDAQRLDCILLFDKSGAAITDQMYSSHVASIGIFVGPEGGWDTVELAQIKSDTRSRVVSLGLRTFRAETAAIIATYLACELFSY